MCGLARLAHSGNRRLRVPVAPTRHVHGWCLRLLSPWAEPVAISLFSWNKTLGRSCSEKPKRTNKHNTYSQVSICVVGHFHYLWDNSITHNGISFPMALVSNIIISGF